MKIFIDLVSWCRNVRAELEVEPRTMVELYLDCQEAELRGFLHEMEALARPLIKLSAIGTPSPVYR